jgi:NADH-quinone oxidoreductase subunit E
MTWQTEALCHYVKTCITRYPTSASAVIPVLHAVQRQHDGWLSEACLQWVAEQLHMPLMAVQEVAHFYTMFHLKPVGRHVVSVCQSISCYLRGASSINNALQKKLGIAFNETTPCGSITLKRTECLAACCQAPAMLVDQTYHEYLTPESACAIVQALQQPHESQ